MLSTISSLLAALAPVIAVFWYLGPAYALYKMAKDLGIKGAWLAWVPYANVYTLGAIADHQMKHNNGKDYKLRNILIGCQIGVVGLPIVWRFVKFFLNALADLLIFPASVCITFLTILAPEIAGIMEAGADWESILALVEQYLPIMFLIVLGFGLLNLIVKLCLQGISMVLNLAANVVAWAVVILKYVSFFKVYELYLPKLAMPLLAGTLALDLLSGVAVVSSILSPIYKIAFPTLLLILAHRKPVYADAPEAAKPAPAAEEVFDILEAPAAEPAPAMG